MKQYPRNGEGIDIYVDASDTGYTENTAMEEENMVEAAAVKAGKVNGTKDFGINGNGVNGNGIKGNVISNKKDVTSGEALKSFVKEIEQIPHGAKPLFAV
jgi:3-dehydroquinate synthase